LSLQLGESRPALDVIFIDLESAVEDFPFLSGIQFVGGGERNFEPGFAEFAAGVFLNLFAKRGNEVEGGVNPGKFAEDFHHAPVIFQGVQARPGEHVTACGRVAILRLMHVPD
jgi:hypothetical protein